MYIRIWSALRRTLKVVLLAGMLLTITGWYLSIRLYDIALNPHFFNDYARDYGIVEYVDGQTMRVRVFKKGLGTLFSDGTYGIHSATGKGVLGKILSVDKDRITREFSLIEGYFKIGMRVESNYVVYFDNPYKAHHLAYRNVQIPTSLGYMPAWYIPGEQQNWVIMVHGMKSKRADALRSIPMFAHLGYPLLMISYRNHENNPLDPSGMIRYGATEWQEVESAVAYALEHGARKVILCGASLGAGVIASFMRSSEYRDYIELLVLDSPNINFGASVWHYGRSLYGRASLPSLWAAMKISEHRYGIDWAALDYTQDYATIKRPVLILHAVRDSMTPIESSRVLKKNNPNYIHLVEFDSGDHVESWNVDASKYEDVIQHFVVEYDPLFKTFDE